MKIIHCADIHLGSSMESNMNNKLANIRRNEVLLAFSNMIDYAVKENIKIILISGDLFDTDNNNSIVKKGLNLIKNHSDISFYYVKGNHDEFVNKDSNFGLSNLFVFDHGFKKYEVEEIVIGGIEQDDKNFYKTIDFNKDKFNILVLHANVLKSDTNNIEDINLKNFYDLNIDYLALGHIHSYQSFSLGNRGIANYSGCLEGRGFDEVGEKGFLVLDVEDNKLRNVEFIKNSIRVIHDITIDITNASDVNILIRKELMGIAHDDIVKITLVGELFELTDKNIFNIQSELDTMFFFSKLVDKSSVKIDYKRYLDKSTLQGEFVRKVLKDESIKDDDKEKIIYYGLKALLGEQI